MIRRLAVCAVIFLAGASLVGAQDDAAPSGPKVGAFLKVPFDAYTLTGKAKGRQHCIVCDFGLQPAVLVFARESPEGKNGALDELLKKLDEVLEGDGEQALNGAAIFLSPEARSAAIDPEVDDPSKLAKEATDREALYARLTKRAEGLKNLIVAAYPQDGPKGYGLDPKADVTVIVYDRLRVKATFAFAEGKLGEADVEPIVTKVRAVVGKKKR